MTFKQTSFTPREIVSELDRFIIGQEKAKKAVAIALRNRWRRQNVDPDLRDEILPKNILMIGPTGVGKTEIARRLAKLANAPFVKVEATKFTEVGYVGRDVEQIIRDLVDNAILAMKEQQRQSVMTKAEAEAEEKILDALVGDTATDETRQKFRKRFRENEINDKEIEIQLPDTSHSQMPTFDIPGMPGAQMGMLNLSDILGKGFGSPPLKTKKTSVEKAFKLLSHSEAEKLIDEDKTISNAIEMVEQNGIIFIDEIDKICTRSDVRGGDVSREGVQRDLLPLIEGTTVSTKHGPIKTDHILFIASGAFHVAKPSDLLPELQGRLPIRVEMESLTKDDFARILIEPDASLIKQYKALMATEKVDLAFSDDSIVKLAELAANINENVENIGARRLHTVLEKLLEEISFEASERSGDHIEITEKEVEDKVSKLALKQDVSKFIL